ncbi:MAG: hypothetical protein MUF06_15190 [Pirellulaceae bacterium]|nr:hypothetical protein [Pirellulaceae bacterium]
MPGSTGLPAPFPLQTTGQPVSAGAVAGVPQGAQPNPFGAATAVPASTTPNAPAVTAEPASSPPAEPIATIDDAIARLQGPSADAARDAAEWLAKQPLDPARQAEVSRALNGLDRDGLRLAGLTVLPIWGTKENVDLLGKVLVEQKFDRQPCLVLAQKLNDDRLLEPLVAVLTDTFDDGKLAEEILAKWGQSADDMLVRHMNHPHDEAHNRIVRILDLRKIAPEALARQAVADLRSENADQRRYAAAWLEETKCEAVPTELHPDATDAALSLLADRSPSVRGSAVDIVRYCADKSHDAQFVKMLSSQRAEEWHAGLHGVIRTGNTAGAKELFAARMKDEAQAGMVCRIMNGAGQPAEDLAIALLKQPLEDRGQAHIAILLSISQIGGKKSLAALTQFERQNGRGKKKGGMSSSVASAVDVARANITKRTKSR